MIVFELTMPNRGSWNGRWSGESERHIIAKYERNVPESVWDRDFFFRWPDGWTACISTKRVHAKDARKLERKSNGFCGYNWMVESIIKCGEIRK